MTYVTHIIFLLDIAALENWKRAVFIYGRTFWEYCQYLSNELRCE